MTKLIARVTHKGDAPAQDEEYVDPETLVPPEVRQDDGAAAPESTTEPDSAAPAERGGAERRLHEVLTTIGGLSSQLRQATTSEDASTVCDGILHALSSFEADLRVIDVTQRTHAEQYRLQTQALQDAEERQRTTVAQLAAEMQQRELVDAEAAQLRTDLALQTRLKDTVSALHDQQVTETVTLRATVDALDREVNRLAGSEQRVVALAAEREASRAELTRLGTELTAKEREVDRLTTIAGAARTRERELEAELRTTEAELQRARRTLATLDKVFKSDPRMVAHHLADIASILTSPVAARPSYKPFSWLPAFLFPDCVQRLAAAGVHATGFYVSLFPGLAGTVADVRVFFRERVIPALRAIIVFQAVLLVALVTVTTLYVRASHRVAALERASAEAVVAAPGGPPTTVEEPRGPQREIVLVPGTARSFQLVEDGHVQAYLDVDGDVGTLQLFRGGAFVDIGTVPLPGGVLGIRSHEGAIWDHFGRTK